MIKVTFFSDNTIDLSFLVSFKFANELVISMTKSIVCAIDLTESSQRVVELAAKMGTDSNTHLTFLFSYRLNQTDKDVFLTKKEVEEDASEKFKRFEEKFLSRGLVSYEFRSEVGFLSDRLESYSRKNDVDLLIIGQQLAQVNADYKKTGIESFLDKLQIPVLVVPNGNLVDNSCKNPK